MIARRIAAVALLALTLAACGLPDNPEEDMPHLPTTTAAP